MQEVMSIEEVRQALKEHIDTLGSGGQVKVARALGYKTGSIISQFLADKYLRDPSTLMKGLVAYLGLQAARKQSPRLVIPFVETSFAQKAMEHIELCHLEGELGVLVSDAGLGKSGGLQGIRPGRHTDAILIESDFSYTARVLFARLCELLDLSSKGNLQYMLDAVIEKLKGTGRLIEVDEAEHLSYRSHEILRRVHDKAGVGICLIGMPRLYHNLKRDKGDYAQLYSRVGSVLHLKVDNGKWANDALLLCQAAGIKGNPEHLIRASNGNPRKLTKLLARAIRIARLNHQEVLHPDVIDAAASMLMF